MRSQDLNMAGRIVYFSLLDKDVKENINDWRTNDLEYHGRVMQHPGMRDYLLVNEWSSHVRMIQKSSQDVMISYWNEN